jgi:hypothetical protein
MTPAAAVSFLPYSSALKMEAIYSYETSSTLRTTRRCNPDHNHETSRQVCNNRTWKVPGSNLQSCTLIVSGLHGAQAWEADSPSPSEEIRCLLCNRMLHYRSKQPTPLDPALSQFNPASTLTHYFFKMSCNIILPSTTRSGRKVLSTTAIIQLWHTAVLRGGASCDWVNRVHGC